MAINLSHCDNLTYIMPFLDMFYNHQESDLIILSFPFRILIALLFQYLPMVRMAVTKTFTQSTYL